MRNLLPIALVAALLAPLSMAMAQSGGSDPLETLSTRFLEGYEIQDAGQVLEQITAGLEPPRSVFLPTAEISPLALAILALEAIEGERDRVRYRLTYGIEQLPNPPKAYSLPLSFIQVDRFSLGSAIRQDAINSYGAEHVAPPEEFDIGPHVSWRLITRPVMGARADILAIGRMELSEAEAENISCLNTPCLSPYMEIISAAPWSEMAETSLKLELPYPALRAGLLTPAAAIEQLTGDSDFAEAEQSRAAPGLPDPFLEAIIEINLAQDAVLEAGLRQGDLMDDSVAAIWRRLGVMPTGETVQTPMAYSAEAYECYRGPQFPPDGGLCP